ncbi:hypothetical protein JXB22_04690 [candidate division WOR-3 bacterium]|nr:hypothetical protein [candidate division WOR-3 bacterium]
MTRRTFLKMVSCISSAAVFIGGLPRLLWGGKWEHSTKTFWKKGLFTQDSIDMSGYGQGMIKARIDGTWEEFALRPASPGFIEWNLKKRGEFLDAIKTGGFPGWGGPHSGAVATYGLGRLDSQFTVNNAIKGIGLAPKDENIDGAIATLKQTFDQSMPEKMDVLKAMYEKKEFFDWRKQTSLELYSTPDFETHTFLNVMENPVATIVFLDIPSYEIRTIARVVHPDDASVLPSEKKLLEFVNTVHEYMHGKFERWFPLLLFYLVEEFDNSPGHKKGVRTVPELPTE